MNVQLDIESLVGTQTDDQFISHVGAFTTLSVGPYAMDSSQAFYLIIKRGLDIILGLIGLVFLVPVTVLVKIVYLISGDTASIFYTRPRIGQYGREFRMYKFRTMVPDAEKILEAHRDPSKYPDLVVRVTGFTDGFLPHTQTGNDLGQVQGSARSRKVFLTMRSSSE